jgi:hypothetical protein
LAVTSQNVGTNLWRPGYDCDTPTIILFQIQSKFAVTTINQLYIYLAMLTSFLFLGFLKPDPMFKKYIKTMPKCLFYPDSTRCLSEKKNKINSISTPHNVLQIALCLHCVCIYKLLLKKKKLHCLRNLPIVLLKT